MIETPGTVTKFYTADFALDKAKLTRILNVLEDRFKESEASFQPEFEITHLDAKKLKLASSDEVFALDNTIKNPIVMLEIATRYGEILDVAGGDNKSRERLLSSVIRYGNDVNGNVFLYVKYENNVKLAHQIFAEMEEQLERTFQAGWGQKLFKGYAGLVLNILLAIFCTYFLFTITFRNSTSNQGHINAEESKQLLQKAAEINSTDAKVDFLFQVQTRALQQSQPTTSDFTFRQLLSLRNFFLAIPVLLVIGCVIYLFAYCYPNAVFLWGDYEEHYKTLVSRRKSIWSLVIISLLLGVVGNLFVNALSSYMRVG